MQTAKQQIRELLEQLPDNTTLNDICHELNDRVSTLYVKQQFEPRIQDVREGLVIHTQKSKNDF